MTLRWQAAMLACPQLPHLPGWTVELLIRSHLLCCTLSEGDMKAVLCEATSVRRLCTHIQSLHIITNYVILICIAIVLI